MRVRSDFTYTIGVTTGQNPVLGASVSDVLPSGVTLLSVTTSRGSCQGSSTIVCNLGDLPAGDLETISLNVHANAGGNFTNTATLSMTSPDPDASNNTANVQTAVYDPCTGVTLLTDPTGDATDQNPAHDVQSISVAEPDFGPGVNKLVFTLKMASLSSVPPDTTWPVTFFYGQNAANPPADQQWFVAMKTDLLGNVTFRYGTGTGNNSGLGNLDAGSGFTPDGTITLVVSNSKIAPASGGNPSAGQLLKGFLTRIRVESQTGSALTPDNAPNSAASGGDYQLSGNAFCANAAPTAVLNGSPTSGPAPLTVNFDASGSSDPDAGDTIASYTFRFGDGSTPVTQSTPTVSHSYANPGTYHATLTVTDSRGLQSNNLASVDIQVTGPPDLKVTNITTSDNQAREGEKVTVSATVKNDGEEGAGPSSTEFRLDNTTILGRVSTPALGAGGTANVSIQWDTRGIKGNHTLYATADAALAVTESNENNNTSSLTVTVQGNKVKNGSFEQANSSGSGPEGWSGSSTGAGDATWSDGGTDGSKSASASGNGGNAAASGSPSWTSDPIAVTAGEVLTLGVSVQSVSASSAATAGLAYLGAAGNLLSTVNLITAPLTTTGFTKLEQAVTIPAGVAQVRVQLVGFAPTDLRTSGK